MVPEKYTFHLLFFCLCFYIFTLLVKQDIFFAHFHNVIVFRPSGEEKYQGVLGKILDILNLVSDRQDHVQDQECIVVRIMFKFHIYK
jgi:hypothetical protein